MRVAHARSSTDKQELHWQLDSLEKVGDDKLTGTQKNRTRLGTLLNIFGSGNTAIIESLSRLGIKILDIFSTLEELKEQG